MKMKINHDTKYYNTHFVELLLEWEISFSQYPNLVESVFSLLCSTGHVPYKFTLETYTGLLPQKL